MRPQYRDSSNDTSLSVFKDSGFWCDFSMGAKGTLTELIELHSVGDVDQWLIDKNFNVHEIVNREYQQPIEIIKKFDKSILLRFGKDYSYWEKRGISPRTLERFGGGVTTLGRLANRYSFPILNGKNEIVGFSGRDLTGNSKRPKWKHIGGVSNWVYPAQINYQTIRKDGTVILVESIGDALALFEAGIENVLVTFGLHLGSGLLNFLIKVDAKCIIIALNNDQVNLVGFAAEKIKGNKGAETIQKQLTQYFDASQIEIALPTKKDFGEMSKEEIISWKQKRVCQPVASSH
jgi:DNA primase